MFRSYQGLSSALLPPMSKTARRRESKCEQDSPWVAAILDSEFFHIGVPRARDRIDGRPAQRWPPLRQDGNARQDRLLESLVNRVKPRTEIFVEEDLPFDGSASSKGLLGRCTPEF
jgi:hypothetical protein